MSRAALLALALVGSVILLTALLGDADKRFQPVEVPTGMTVKRQITLLEGSPTQLHRSMDSTEPLPYAT